MRKTPGSTPSTENNQNKTVLLPHLTGWSHAETGHVLRLQVAQELEDDLS